ncbi:transmembrane protein 60 isoform X1 [Balaenoptera ricei]|uniref:transmembrane protein 60 isoform X1 n=1 Tax=Balaenoptera ricei TaxID=2746895 RepID=UPI0028BDA3A6|nr:transmembrane protein 60 isoform X1 [Balaenoptera ricei]
MIVSRSAGAGGCRGSHRRGGRRVAPRPPTSIPRAALLLPRPASSSASVRTQRPPRGPPQRGGDAGSYRRKGRRAARRRLECARETPRQTPPPPREPDEPQRSNPPARYLQNRRPTPSPAGFCAGACSLRALAGRARGGVGRPAEAGPNAGKSDWHLWTQWNHGHSRLCLD